MNNDNIIEYYCQNEANVIKYCLELNNIIIANCNNDLTTIEGCYFSLTNNPMIDYFIVNKQANLYYCGSNAKTNICEIGFNGGHSSMLLLAGRKNNPINLTIFDICEHTYVKPCLQYIKNTFNFANINFIEGDSTKTIPKYIENNNHKYDLIHIDGGHSEYCINADFKNADILCKIGGIIIIDDCNIDCINNMVDLYIKNNNYTEIKLLRTTLQPSPHRIIYKN